MKTIFKIFGDDVRAIYKNFAAIVIILALIFLPSVYALFNIKASWDPYGSTSGVKVAVVNEDQGITFEGETLKVGDEVVETLKDNHDIGWEFVDAKTANDGLEKGKYYASITFPKDFSDSISSIATDQVSNAKIIYTSNEKLNAIAPKITEKGATTVQNQVNQTVIASISDVLLKTAKDSGKKIEDQLPQLDQVQKDLDEINTKLKQADKTLQSTDETIALIKPILVDIKKQLPAITTTLNNTAGLGDDIKTFVASLQKTLNMLTPTISQDVNTIADFAASINDAAIELNQLILSNTSTSKQDAITLIDGTLSKVSTAKSINKSLINFMTSLNDSSTSKSLSNNLKQLNSLQNNLSMAETKLISIKSTLQNNQNPSSATLNDLMQITNNAKVNSANIAKSVNSEIIPEIKTILNGVNSVADGALDNLNAITAKMPDINKALGSTIATLDNAALTVDDAKAVLPTATKIIKELQTDIQTIQDSKAIDAVVRFLKANLSDQVEFLKEPVKVETKLLYPIPNYGSAMSPFYTILSLWVGGLLMVSILSTKLSHHYKANFAQEYFGKFTLFGVIGLLQGLVVALGCIYFLGIYVVDPTVYILVSMFAAFIFTLMIYSFVSIFGDAGKVIAIVLLVLQLAGSGGTFPVQVLPDFFQTINPYLPFTYGISALREAVGGIVPSILQKDIMVLATYGAIMIVVTIFLKKGINKLIEPFVASWHNSKLGGH